MSDEKKKHRQPYPAEFGEQMVALARAGRTPDELAEEFGPTPQTTGHAHSCGPRVCGGWGSETGRGDRPSKTHAGRCVAGPGAPLSLACAARDGGRYAKKSFPLSSTTTKAGKSTTSIFQTASMPSSS